MVDFLITKKSDPMASSYTGTVFSHRDEFTDRLKTLVAPIMDLFTHEFLLRPDWKLVP